MEKLDDGVKDEQKEKEEAAKVLNILRRISSFTYNCSLLLDRRSIELSGAREKEGHIHYKHFLRASK